MKKEIKKEIEEQVKIAQKLYKEGRSEEYDYIRDRANKYAELYFNLD